MILVTVGTQLPFDRLIAAMDELSPSLGMPVFAQIGRATYTPRNMEWVREIAPAEFGLRLKSAVTLVAHAGIGTVLTAQRYGKPLILFPRRADLGEHRSDHQLATCAQLEGRQGVYIAEDADELRKLLQQPLMPATSAGESTQREQFSGRLREALKSWS